MNSTMPSAITSDPLAALAGGGEMGERTRTYDWSKTPIGPVTCWPQSLKTAVRIMLSSRYAMWLGWGPEFTFFYNDAYASMTLGPKHPWALGRSAREVWAEIWPDIGPRAEKVIATGEATWDEGLLLFLERRGFPEETYHTFSYSPIPDDTGGVGGMLCVVTEDTERAIGERRLRTLRELAARTTEAARSAEDACRTAARTLADNPLDLPFVLVYLLDAEGQVARLAGVTGLADDSPAAPQRVDLSSDDDLGWPFRMVMASGHAAIVTDLITRWGRLRCGPWPEPPTQAVVAPLAKPGQTRPAGFVVAGLSPRLVFTDDYKGFTELLAGHVATAVAHARAYEEERQRAEALAVLDRAKTAFFSNVSHEFRTPLTLILGPIEDLLAARDPNLSPAIIEQLESVNRNGLRLLRLVNTLLDVSRIEAGRVQAFFQPTDLAQFTADLASNFRSACERAGLRLVVDCPPLREPIYIDRGMWEKIILNLLSNAFKFTLKGEIRVGLHRCDDWAVVQIADTGTGIPAEEMPRLFERFHRVQHAQGRTHEGSGIGLALVQELVKLHNGTVSVDSIVGQGTTFTIHIPRGVSHLPADQIHDGRSPIISEAGASPFVEEALRWLPDQEIERSDVAGLVEMPGESSPVIEPDRPLVVVADDNADMRQYITRLLAEQFQVIAVPDGVEAVAAVKARKPALMLTDVMMPRLDGFGVLRALRADPQLCGVPVVILSARAGEESRVEGMQAGADDYLVKPFSARELLARVSAHVQMARLRREAIESLRASEERFRGLVNATSDVVYRMSPDWTEMRFLQGREFIADTNEPTRSWLDKYIHPDDQPHVMSVIKEAVRTRTVFQLEHRVLRVDGTLGWTYSRAVPLVDLSGEVVEWFGAASDVTARKEAEAALRERETFTTGLLGSITDGFYAISKDWHFTFVNDEILRWASRNRHEMVGHHLWTIFPDAVGNEAYRQLHRAMAERIVVEYEVFYHPWQRWFLSKAFPTADGGLAVYSRDITHRKEADVLYTRQKHLLELIATAEPLDTVLSAACRMIEELEPGLFCAVMIPDESGQHPATAIGAGLPETYIHGFGQLIVDARVKTPSAAAIATGQAAIVPDVESDDRFAPEWRALLLSHGLRSCRSVPVMGANGAVVAAFAHYRSEPGDPSPVNTQLIQTATHLVAIAIEGKRTEQERERLVATLESLIASAPVGIVMFDAQMRYQHLNQPLAEMNGLPPEAHVGRTVQEIVPDLYEAARPVFDRVLNAGETISDFIFEGETPRSPGVKRVWQESWFPVAGVAGRASGVGVIVQEITEQRRLEAERQQYQQTLHTLIDRCPFGIYVVDADFRIAHINAGSQDAAFVNVRPVIGRPLDEALRAIWPEPVASECISIFRHTLDTGEPYSSQGFMCPRADIDRTESYEWELHRITMPDGRPGVVCYYFDSTRLRRTEQELKETNQQKDEFLATLAHELRNPLAPIRNGLHIMKLAGSDVRTLEKARSMMERQLGQMTHLIDDLMDLSRISRGKIDLQKTRMRLTQALSDAIETSRPLIERHRHELILNIPDESILVDGDNTRLTQVFANLLNNAAKYTEPGGRIYLRMDRDGSDVVVEVEDTGVGIPDPMLTRVFDMFSQVDRSLEKAQGGLGIGLNIVKRLVEMHGGSIAARSPGARRGSTFVIRLPSVSSAIETSVDTPVDLQIHPVTRRRILVVDDNRDGATTLAEMLSILGNETKTAFDGAEAVAVAEAFQPEVILMDIGMPKLNGYDACRQIRETAWGAKMVIVAQTGWGQDDDKRKSQEAGFNFHMVKPVDPAALEKTLAETYTRSG